MDRDQDRRQLFTRRALMLSGLKLGLMSGLVARLYYLQVVEAEAYAMLADDNRISARLLAPSRGVVTDRFGVPLAVNRQNFRALITAEHAGDVPRVLGTLANIIALTDVEVRRIERDILRRRRFMPVTVKEGLNWEQVAILEVNTPELPGVSIDVGEIRDYPYGPSTAHVLGYVGAVSEADLRSSPDPVLALPGFQIGKTGMERALDVPLRGQAGTSRLEVNAVGRIIRELSRDEGQAGREVQLTIDIGLQEIVQTRLALETSASCVVMDVGTGGIYAMCSSPTFDPNLFSGGTNPAAWNELRTNPIRPMHNRTIAGQYPPGSTFKMMVGLAALEAGMATPRFRVFCPGHMDLGDRRFHCWKRGGHGSVDMVGAIRESCDVYFYELARRLGIDRIHDMCLRFGLGRRTDIEIPGEQPGNIPNRLTKMGRGGSSWQPGDTLNASIGQGSVLATPLQLAVMTARLVNGGHAVKPHLTRQIRGVSEETTSWPSLGLGKQNLDLMVQAMNAVTMDMRGTAFSHRIRDRGLEFGGKTGTSQVRTITLAERKRGIVKNEDRPWHLRDHALFVGYAPIAAPRYAVAVVVEHGGGGSAIAAPVARDVLMEAQKRNPARIPAGPPVGPSAQAGPDRAG